MNSNQVNDNSKLVDLEDNKFDLSELLSKSINLILFYNTNCLGCTGRAIPFGYDISVKHKEVNLIVVHVNLGTRKEDVVEIKNVFTDSNPPFPVYRDIENLCYDKFHCEGTPHWLLMNENGDVLHSIFGSQEGAKFKIELALEELIPKFS